MLRRILWQGASYLILYIARLFGALRSRYVVWLISTLTILADRQVYPDTRQGYYVNHFGGI